MTDSYIALDLETTGLEPKKEKITEIAALKVEHGQITGRFVTLENPKRPLTERVVELTGITDDMLKDAPVIEDIIGEVLEFIGNLPYLIIVVILSMVLGRSMFSLVFAMSLTAWVGTARMVRGQILQIKEQDYVQAATALGASTGRIIVKHLLPNTLGIIMVDITMSVPGFIFSEAFLSYIGLGVRPPETSWGALASAGQQQLMFYPHELFFPCLMIVLTMLTFHLIGDGLSDALDPKLRK